MFDRYSILARQAVMVARLEAGQVGAGMLDSEHMLIGIWSVHPELQEILKTRIDLNHLRTQCGRWHTASSPISNSQDIPITSDLSRIFAQAAFIENGHCIEIRTEHLLLSMIREPCHASQMLADCGISEVSF